ncbi:hypothetical protein C0583_01090 [Candidatus Parcubacteria bacterium]|nr:MAG: hypothetical protein C0583_01090 [Candidatus Parcubacteria bacterium]
MKTINDATTLFSFQGLKALTEIKDKNIQNHLICAVCQILTLAEAKKLDLKLDNNISQIFNDIAIKFQTRLISDNETKSLTIKKYSHDITKAETVINDVIRHISL